MAKMGLNPFGRDGVKSLNNYFLYTLTAFVLATVMVILIFLLIGANAASLFAGGAGVGALAIFTILCIAAGVLGVYGVLSLMFGVRDIRRSNLRHSSDYTSISRWFKYIIIATVVMDIIVVALSIAVALSSLQDSLYGGTAAPSPYSGVLLVFTVILMALSILWAWELSRMYKFLSADLSQKDLYTSGTLLLVGIGIIILAALVGSVFGVNSSSAAGIGVVAIAVIALEFVGMVVYAVSLWLGYKGTRAALK